MDHYNQPILLMNLFFGESTLLNIKQVLTIGIRRFMYRNIKYQQLTNGIIICEDIWVVIHFRWRYLLYVFSWLLYNVYTDKIFFWTLTTTDWLSKIWSWYIICLGSLYIIQVHYKVHKVHKLIVITNKVETLRKLIIKMRIKLIIMQFL